MPRLSGWQLAALFGLLLVGGVCAGSGNTVSVYFDKPSGQFSVKPGLLDKSAIARATFYDEIAQTGWGRLYVHSNKLVGTANAQSFAAGLAEGYLTAERIAQHWGNFYAHFFTNKSALFDAVHTFFMQQNNWMLSMIKSNTQDPYWRQIGYLSNQMQGLYQGYQMQQSHLSLPDLSYIQMYMLGSWGDLLDLPNALQPQSMPNFNDMTIEELERHFAEIGHCSALIAVNGDMSKMFSGHTAWFTYTFMLRIMKHYDLPYNDPSTIAAAISFSSYPGSLMSGDDFYLTSAGLNVIETSISVPNKTIWQNTTPQSLFCWMRTMLANKMSSNGQQWTSLFSKFNSGTYNNQWMVVDYKLFTPKNPLPENLLWIAEQIPGLIKSADVTHVLRFGYWPSYNIAFFKEIRDLSGWTEISRRTPGLGYETAPRANIFRRNHTDVIDLDSLQRMLRYNNWENDPYSLGSAGNQISSRFDLVVAKPSCAGGYDSKVTTSDDFQDMTIFAQSGPSHDQQPVFSWSTSPCPNLPHVGQPETWNFDWIAFKSE